MNNIVKNAIAAAKRKTVAENEISGYDIYWLTIRPVNGGVVTEADKKKLHKSGMSFPNEKEIKYHILKGEYEKEVARLKGLKLSKPMQVTYITDTQFGRKMGPTQKQLKGSFVIGNSGVADETVSNAIAAHRAKNDAEGEKVMNEKEVEKRIGGTRITKWADDDITYSLSWTGNEGAISGSGTKVEVIEKAKKNIATLKSKAAEMEKVLAYLQKL